ncbi:MAG: zf-HC2 domain-containing protein [Dechloromonas sp.]|nr:zf-HC2 domain-containing protein [Dechloromonas sp.]
MLTCMEVTRLLSEAQDRKLTLAEKMHLEIHLAMCKGCKNFRSQMSFLREACRRYAPAQSKVDE